MVYALPGHLADNIFDISQLIPPIWLEVVCLTVYTGVVEFISDITATDIIPVKQEMEECRFSDYIWTIDFSG